MNIFHSLDRYGIQNFEFFHTNDHAATNRDRAFLAKVETMRPSHIIHVPTIMAVPGNISLETMGGIRRTLGIPIINYHLDAIKPVWRAMVIHLAQEADLVILLDGAAPEPYAQRFPRPETKCISLWSPTPAQYAKTSADSLQAPEKDISVSFLGTLSGYTDRSEIIDHLLANNINVTVNAPGQYLEADSYYQILRRSQIVINFSTIQNWQKYGARPIYQLKGRVFEAAACHSFLLEQDNPLTPRYFTPGVEYDSFTDPADALAKIRRYLLDTGTRKAMAARMHRSFMEKYHPRIFWERVFAAL